MKLIIIGINDTQLSKYASCRHLSVKIASDLSPTQHILKAHQRTNHIIRCFISGDTTLLVKAFFVYVPPILEYNYSPEGENCKCSMGQKNGLHALGYNSAGK